MCGGDRAWGQGGSQLPHLGTPSAPAGLCHVAVPPWGPVGAPGAFRVAQGDPARMRPLLGVPPLPCAIGGWLARTPRHLPWPDIMTLQLVLEPCSSAAWNGYVFGGRSLSTMVSVCSSGCRLQMSKIRGSGVGPLSFTSWRSSSSVPVPVASGTPVELGVSEVPAARPRALHGHPVCPQPPLPAARPHRCPRPGRWPCRCC